MKNPINVLVFVLIIGGFLNYFLSRTYVTTESRIQGQKAFEEYVQGENAKTVAERKAAFNEALSLYTELEERYHPQYGNGKLYYNIGNSYYQVGEYPMAVLNYYRARALRPRDVKVKDNLNSALSKLGISREEKSGPFRKILFFHHFFSLPERLQLFFGFSVLAFAAGSFYVWKRSPWLKRISFLGVFCACVLLLSLGYTHYIASIEGVMVKSSSLYRGAGFQYAKVVEEPVLSGNKVEILEVLHEGRWLKILTSEGNLGYIPQEAIRTI